MAMLSPLDIMSQALAASQAGNFTEAERLCRALLAAQPGYFDALHLLGVVYGMRGNPAQGLRYLDKAVHVNPGFPAAHWHRGIALQELGRLKEAAVSYDRALRLKPDYVEALVNRGFVLQELKRPEEALACYIRVIELRPDYASAHYNESLCRLQLGDFEKGWPKHEWRLQVEQLDRDRRSFAQPLWLGEEPLRGERILLHAEQGLGDTLQFCRYAKLVAAQGATVLMEVQPWLMSVLTRLEGVDRLIAYEDKLPEFDYHCPLLSLPLAFKTTLDTIPAQQPYLASDPEIVRLWRNRLGERKLPRVGLVWSGSTTHKNDRNRSIPLVDFSGLVSGQAQFVSLQKEVRAADQPLLTRRGDILHFGEGLRDFNDTAALIELMDVVITVDTAVAHLAGGMGKPVWILLPFNPDWRWLMERSDSPWYPSARLFRQPTRGDWKSVIPRVRGELAKFLAGSG